MRHSLALLLLIPLAAGAAEHRVEYREVLDWRAGAQVSVENLAGTVEIVAADGDQLVVEAVVVAEARTGADAEVLARSVTLERDGDALWMAYPTDRHVSYVYDTGRGNTQTSLTYRGEYVTVTSRSRARDGVEVHADLRIAVPAGVELAVDNKTGRVTATGVRGELALSTGAGRIESADGEGTLSLHSGSGRLEVSAHRGSVTARTGSGRIGLAGVAGSAHDLHSGSGSVEAADVVGNLKVRTGSGSVRIDGASGVGEMDVTTGSGSIRANGDFGALTALRMRAGSGSIRMHSTAVPDMSLSASAGSGSVSVVVPGVQVTRSHRNRIEAVLGAGGGEATLTTGSGSIHFIAGG